MEIKGISTAFAQKMTQVEREFYLKLERFAELIGRFGVSIKALSDTGVERFSQLSRDDQNNIIRNFDGYSSLLQGAAGAGIDLRNERDLLTYVLPRLGLAASADALETIEQGHIIEVYTEDHIQIFRNIEFMQYCNYSLLDLLSYTFFELYERSPAVTNKLIELSEKIFKTDIDKIEVGNEFPRHLLRENFSTPRSEFLIDMRYMWPLYKGAGKKGGLLSMTRVVQVVNIGTDTEKLAFI